MVKKKMEDARSLLRLWHVFVTPAIWEVEVGGWEAEVVGWLETKSYQLGQHGNLISTK